jgi:hypothetical protein
MGMAALQSNTVTEITRRDIRRLLTREGFSWSGDLGETEFLSRLYNLSTLPSHDSRFRDAGGDIWQHRVNNYDWDHDWVFDDERLQLGHGHDEVYLNFLAEMVHPAVQPDRELAKRIVSMLNELLEPDGWRLAERSTISGRPIYGPQRLTNTRHAIQAAKNVTEAINEDYIHCQVTRMTSAVESDPELAIGTAKELIETVCQTILAERGKPVTDKPELLPLVRRTLEELKLIPEGVADEDKGARSIKSLLGNLAAMSQSMAELRNLYGTGHGKRSGRKGLAPRHARLIVGAATTLVVFLYDTHNERQS